MLHCGGHLSGGSILACLQKYIRGLCVSSPPPLAWYRLDTGVSPQLALLTVLDRYCRMRSLFVVLIPSRSKVTGPWDDRRIAMNLNTYMADSFEDPIIGKLAIHSTCIHTMSCIICILHCKVSCPPCHSTSFLFSHHIVCCLTGAYKKLNMLSSS